MSETRVKTANVHGRSVSYLEAGEGPVLLLVHGIAGSCEHWREVVEPLARHHTAIAPDFPGHGASEAGAGDYSIGALASGLRDLLLALGHERASLVGHSLGGGVAMQLAYQYPEMIERLVLVSSGGLGPEVSPVLRAAALPGADLFISVTAGAGQRVGSAVGRGLAAITRAKSGCRWLINRFHSRLGAASDGTSSASDCPSSYHRSPKAWLADRFSASQPAIRWGSTRSTVTSSGSSMRV